MPLQNSETLSNLLEAIVSSTRHLIISTDLDGTVTFFNAAAENELGYKASEVVGKHSPALWHDADEVVSRAEELSKELNRKVEPGFDVFALNPQKYGKESREWTFRSKDGSTFPAYLTVTCIKNDNNQIKGYLGVIEDITERKRAENEIKEAKSFLDLIISNNPDYVFVKDEQYRIINANPAFLSLYPEEIRDKVIGYTTVEKYKKEEADAFLAKDKEAFLKGQSEVIERIRMPNDKTVLLNTKKTRFENSLGEKFILGIARDVTEREELIERLVESNEALARFAYVCSHDLQEPLRMITSFSKKLETHLRENLKSDEKGSKYLQFVTDGAERAYDLITDILHYSSIEKNTQNLEQIDLNLIMKNISDDLHMDIVQKNAKINHKKLPTIKGNRTQIYQLFMNLINNALKYCSKEQNPIIDINCTQEDSNRWLFSVRDNGIGIEKKHLKKIFEVFGRLHSRREYPGTGIGLSICQKVVSRHGGKIWVESEPGIGSTFYFTLLKDKEN